MTKIVNIAIIGYIAGTLATIAFLPQVIKSIREPHTKAISLPMYILFCAGVACWLIYGLLIKDIPLLIANIVTFILAAIVLSIKLRNRVRYGEK
jgi:MtN3 and saliva related transmembrane protein